MRSAVLTLRSLTPLDDASCLPLLVCYAWDILELPIGRVVADTCSGSLLHFANANSTASVVFTISRMNLPLVSSFLLALEKFVVLKRLRREFVLRLVA